MLVLLLEFVRLSLTDTEGFWAFTKGVCLLVPWLGSLPRAELTKIIKETDLTYDIVLDSDLATSHNKAVVVLVFKLVDYFLYVLITVGEPLFEERVATW